MDVSEPKLGLQSRTENFHPDVMHNILSRLPLKSVIQCRCVCKSWLDIIRDPTFGKLHFAQSESEPTLLILTHRVIAEKNIISISCLRQEGPELLVNETAIGNMVSSHSWCLVGTCDGLLCFVTSGHDEIIMVCNPVTMEHVILPKPTIVTSPESHTLMLAFGFDLLTKKYKVVRLFCPKRILNRVDLNIHITAEIYTLGDTGLWRKVKDFDRPPHGKAVYANGAVHWLVHPQFRLHGERIVSFDLEKEEFKMASHIRFGPQISLVELGKCLSVVDTSSPTLVEVSVQKYFDGNSWEKEYILPVRRPRAQNWECPRLICAHERNGAFMIWLQHSLFSYERKALRRRDLKLARFPTWLDWEICSGYRGSLVPLEHLNDATEDNGTDVRFISDMELYSSSTQNLVVGERIADLKCDSLVACFHKNGMFAH